MPRALLTVLFVTVLVLPAPVARPAVAAEGEARSRVTNPPEEPNPGNPLAGRLWGVYKGDAEQSWPPYESADGATKRQLARIALTPKSKFFGDWISVREIRSKVRSYIRNAQAGHPGALVQLTLFRVEPWGQEACKRKPTRKEQRSYRTYVTRFARAIGNAHAAVVVQPDGPVAQCGAIYSRLVKYAVRAVNRQPNTITYIEMGSADWVRGRIAKPVRLLVAAGVAQARGFALATSHTDATAANITFGSRIVAALKRKGLGRKHFVVDTADNGRPFTNEWYREHRNGSPERAKECRRLSQRHCVTLGIPPSPNVSDPDWRLSPRVDRLAARHVDGFLWLGRPWLFPKGGEFVLRRALNEVRTSPYDALTQGAQTP